MRSIRTVANVSHAVALIGGFVGFAAQWLIFRPGNFSETRGEVFIPLLGQHGIYTTRLLGSAWYAGFVSLTLGLLIWIAALGLKRRSRD